MSKKKIIICLLLILLTILSVSGVYHFKSNKKDIKRKRKHNEIAIYIQRYTDVYKVSDEIPKGWYKINRKKSYCKNNGVIGDYDSTLGKVSFSFVGTDSCYLYFDQYGDFSIPPEIVGGTIYTNDGEVFDISDMDTMEKYCTVNVLLDSGYENIDNYSPLAYFKVTFNNIIAVDALIFVHGIKNTDTCLVKQKINGEWTEIESEAINDVLLKIPNLSNEGEIAIYIKTS